MTEENLQKIAPKKKARRLALCANHGKLKTPKLMGQLYD